jgi:hypothetical protein
LEVQEFDLDDDDATLIVATIESCRTMLRRLVQIRTAEGFEYDDGFASDDDLDELGRVAFYLGCAIEGDRGTQVDYDNWSREYEAEQS